MAFGPRTPADEPLRLTADAPDPAAAAAARRSEPGGASALSEVLYVLVASCSVGGFTAPIVEGPATASGGAKGWMLLAVHGQRWLWSMPLAGRGAATTAPPRVAQAVAVRVLHDFGVRVRAWHGAGGAEQPTYRAELEAPPEPGPCRPVRLAAQQVLGTAVGAPTSPPCRPTACRVLNVVDRDHSVTEPPGRPRPLG